MLIFERISDYSVVINLN